ncbi:MAG: LysM peptidoglycan-binding domain-containing protein [Sedimentisphaerales bacterium]|nr:LysM peptidoglycan-binding domain-containing protein [Sedimentisphaerales bacterium]
MTSDAKIGLLLGLVFIFVIAFIINGLPNFGSRAQDADAAPATTFESDNLGLADQAQNAQERLDWEALLDQSETDEEPVLATEQLPVPAQELTVQEPESTVPDGTVDVRSVYALDNLVNRVSRTVEDVVRELSEASQAVTMQRQTQEPVPVIDPPKPKPTETARTSGPSQIPPATNNSPVRKTLMRTYVVQDGDVLATVAKKMYGPVEGNRLVNIRRIYQANALVLNSPDEIYVGQTLVIPPLPEAKPSADRPNPTLSEPMFERVQEVGRRNLVDMREPKPEGRWYVVVEGDSLWKIASTQLGSGARCDEIAKMNTDILKNKDTLDIGMRLRLPSK